MPDKSTDAAKARRTSAVERMAGLAAAPAPEPEATAERSDRAATAAARRKRSSPPTTGRTVRASAMPAEASRPAKAAEYRARISHSTTYDQRDALEEVKRWYQRNGRTGRSVSMSALLRAAADICLSDARLRERMAREADLTWSDNTPRGAAAGRR
jgi:hypothetical protein